MSLLPILRWPDPRLAEICDPVAEISPDLCRLADDMLETMYAAPGRGLAAPQVGQMVRLFVMDTAWKEGPHAPQVFFNPSVAEVSDTLATQTEGCLSIPGVSAEVTRPDRVRLSWTDRSGAACSGWFEGFDAACVQHEMDHLEGRVTLDHLSDGARARVLAEYAEAIS